MGKEYIEREILQEMLMDEHRCGYLDAIDINSVPTADVAPVVHGKWESVIDKNKSIGDLEYHRCSFCKEMQLQEFRYCPNCGARMDGEG